MRFLNFGMVRRNISIETFFSIARTKILINQKSITYCAALRCVVCVVHLCCVALDCVVLYCGILYVLL